MTEQIPLEEARQLQGRYVVDEAQKFEAPRLRATAWRAYQSTALHEEHLAAVLQTSDWNMEDLPTLQKSDIRRHFPRGLTDRMVHLPALIKSGDLALVSTSGTTGERLQVYSDTRIRRLPERLASYWNVAALPTERPLRTAVFTSPMCSGTTCTRGQVAYEQRISFEHTLFVESTENPFEIREAQVARAAEEFERFQADLWLVHPIYLAELARSAERLGIRLPRPKAILSSYQYLSHCQRKVIARLFDAPIFELYTATELGGSQIATTCGQGRLHVRLDQVFVEILRAGEPMEPGQLGRVVVTTHHPLMPLIRYALGDLARFRLEPCACDVGSAWPSLVLEGRLQDAFVRAEKIVTTRAVDDALREFDFDLYQLVESEPGVFTLWFVSDNPSHKENRALRETLGDLLAPVTLSLRQSRTLPFDKSQKFRFTVPHASTRHEVL
jgi:phenylacetate-CoA ligase